MISPEARTALGVDADVEELTPDEVVQAILRAPVDLLYNGGVGTFVKAGTELAALEMIRSGTTTFADMYYFEDQVAEACDTAGMRCVPGETLIEFPAPDNKTISDALALLRLTSTTSGTFWWLPSSSAWKSWSEFGVRPRV